MCKLWLLDGTVPWCLAVVVLLGGAGMVAVHASPAHPRPFLMPPAEKQRLLERIRSDEPTRRQYEEVKARADKGNFGDAALVYALEGGPQYAETVRKGLLGTVRYRGPRLDEDVAAGGHREGNMDFYWNTAEARWYDLVHPALSEEDRKTIEAFYRKLGRYWKDSLTRWTTTPNLVFPIHYHGAVIGFCMDDPELIEWGLRDPGGQFGPSRGGLFPVLDAMLRDGAIWDEATIYAAVNVLEPMMQLAIVHKLYYGKDLFAYESPKGGSIRKLLDGYIALGYPLERTGVGGGSFHVCTYGDGSTESPYGHHHGTDSLYLVNLPWMRDNDRFDLTRVLEQAYHVSRDAKYAFFLSHVTERTPSLLYGEPIPPGSVKAPPAPSSIFPEAGIAMLRAEESPDYWTHGSIAVLQMMSRGYGHGHRDKMEIVLHAGGRLLYPDMNCIQYEPPSINWTASSVAHNTLVVDRGQTASAPFTTRHEFAPEVKFLATAASCYPGVAQTRVLALTREYLLDLFQADSDLPHTYDWALHAIGKLQWEHPALYRPSRDLVQNYWWVQDERSRQTGQTWRADFVQANGLAIRGMGRQTEEWFRNGAAVRMTMVGEAGTCVYGADGPIGGPPADAVMNPEGNLPMLLVRRQTRRTVFAAVHEPYRQGGPRVADARKVAESKDAYVAEVRADAYVDRLAVAFGEQADKPVHALRSGRDPQEVFVFRNYGYLRESAPAAGAKARLVGRGNWIGFRLRCPELPAEGALVLNGTGQAYRKDGEYVVYGDLAAAPAPQRLLVALEGPLPQWAVPGQTVQAAWTLHNTGPAALSDVRLRLNVPPGCDGADEPARVEQIPAGGRRTARLSLRMPAVDGDGRRVLAVTPEVSYGDEKGRQKAIAAAEGILLTQPLEIIPPAEPVRLGARSSREVVLPLKDWSLDACRPCVRVALPAGIAAEVVAPAGTSRETAPAGAIAWKLPPIEPGATMDVRLRLTTEGAAKGGLHFAAVQVAADPQTGWAPAVPLPITVGPTLVEDNSYPTFGEYVIYAPRYTLRMSKRYGTSRFLRDDAGRPRYEATFWSRRPPAATEAEALPRVRIGEENLLAWGTPAQFLWPTEVPAAVSVGTRRSRLAWKFEDDAVRIEPVSMWSAEAPHEFIFPSGQPGWTCWGGSPQWLEIVAVDAAGAEQSLTKPPAKDKEILIRAAALMVNGYDEAICFAVDRPQKARFDGPSLALTVAAGEPIWFGLASPGTFRAWRQARTRR